MNTEIYHYDKFLCNDYTQSNPMVLNSNITKNEIPTTILNMKSKNSTGLDGLPAELFKHQLDYIVTICQKLFNSFLDYGVYSEFQCKTVISPIHKKGSTTNVANYRGIAFRPVF